MKIAAGTTHKIAEIVMKEAEISMWNDSPALTASLAYISKDHLTCGKLTVSSSMCSKETLEALQQLVNCIEKDAAAAVFDISTEETDPDSSAESVSQL